MKSITFIFIFLVFNSIAQKTKKVTQKSEYSSAIEEFYVLQSDQEFRQGTYKKLGYKNCLVISGFYDQNQKDSIWTEYFWRTEIIKSQGFYKHDQKIGQWVEYYRIGNKNSIASKGVYANGKRIGEWEFYDREGELTQKYDYDLNRLNYFKQFDSLDTTYEVIMDNVPQKVSLESPPMYIGGTYEESHAIPVMNINYPQEAIENDISGTVWISFFIDVDGKAINHEVESGIGHGCDEEAIRVVKEMPDNWLPGVYNGQKVTAKYRISIKFNLE